MSTDPLEHLYSRQATGAQPSVIRDICALVARPQMRSLAGGWPDPQKFPVQAIGRISEQLIAEHGDLLLQYGSTEGLLDLRTALARRMNAEGIAGLDADNLVITHGSSQGISLAAQVFLNPDDVLLVGCPPISAVLEPAGPGGHSLSALAWMSRGWTPIVCSRRSSG
jgi:2-aminoadipate transaminase